MTIQVRRSGSGYLARVTSPEGGEEWRAPAPMGLDELIEQLRRLGCHQTDIGDALYAADPDWLERT